MCQSDTIHVCDNGKIVSWFSQIDCDVIKLGYWIYLSNINTAIGQRVLED
jgi:hypothetical protein